MRLPSTAHTTRPWRIHEIAYDFDLVDVWALPTPGGPDDFPTLVRGLASFDPSRSPAPAVRALFAIRWSVGRALGWDGPEVGIGARVQSLRDRLPEDLQNSAVDVDFDAAPFTPVYQTENEFAAEIANRTVHGVVHLGWVPDEAGRYRGQMAVLVKRNGLLGAAYMTAIAPFRHLIVYPTMLREIERSWRDDVDPRAVRSRATR